MANKITITPQAFERSDSGAAFLMLGETVGRGDSARERSLRKRIKNKVLRRTTHRVKAIWGTLGMAEGTQPHWSGSIIFSRQGNERSVPEESSMATVREIDTLRHTQGVLSPVIIERFISFENVHFSDLPQGVLEEDSLPLLRLTLMLGSDEGALVYYQLHKLGTTGRNEQPEEIAVETIAPDSMEPDRVNYLFRLHPSRKIIEDDRGQLKLDNKDTNERFIIKILTFHKSVNRFRDHFFNHQHSLMAWRPESRTFAPQTASLKGDVPTLLLLHGTASSTHQAFKGLLSDNNESWIARQHVHAGGRYQQILAFDHPTFSEDAEMNAKVLSDMLGRGFRFTQPIDLVTHSRGGLVGKYIALYLQETIPIRRGILVACANGVGYFSAARYLSYLISVLRYSNIGNPMLLSALQQPVHVIREMPGSRLMTPGHHRLTEVLANPPGGTATRFMPVAGDYDYRVNTSGRLLRRWAERGLDKLIGLCLGNRHDWVVGTKEQLIVAPNHQVPDWDQIRHQPGFVLPARHSDYFPDATVKTRLDRFLAE